MQKRLSVLLLFLSIFLYGKAQEVTIIAETSGFETGDLLLRTPNKDYKLEIKDNRFKVIVPLKEDMEIFQLRNLKKKTHKYIYAESGVMKGKVYKKGFLKYTMFSGSKNQDLENELKKSYASKKMDKVYQLLSEHTDIYTAIAFMFKHKDRLDATKLKEILSKVKAPFVNVAEKIKVYLATKNVKKMKVGDKAYDFEWNEKGKVVKLSDFRGKYVMINLTSMGCGFCWLAYEDMNKLEDNYKDQLKIISIHVWGDTKKRWDKVTKKINKPIFKGTTPWDTKLQTEIESIYYSNTLPTFILIDKDGIIIKWWKGRLPMKKVIKQIKKGK